MSIIEKALAKAREEAHSTERKPQSVNMDADAGLGLGVGGNMGSGLGLNAGENIITGGVDTGMNAGMPHPPTAGGGMDADMSHPLKDAPPRQAAGSAMAFVPGEEYRLLKERLLNMSKKDMLNLFMVTSADRSEGKSTIAFNLAISLAHEFDHTSLLIDADMRGATCHSLLGVERTPGLSNCLLNGLGFNEALVHTGIGRMAFIPAGKAIDNPAELFSSNRMHSLLLEIKHRYPDRMIIIDTPPILPFAETRSLSRMVDGTLLVVRENVTSRDSLDLALQCLDGSMLLGLIYNDSSGLKQRAREYDTV